VNPLDFLKKYIEALINPAGFIGEAADVAAKLRQQKQADRRSDLPYARKTA